MFRYVFRRSFGALAFLIGASVALWVLFNLLIERQSEFDWHWTNGVGMAGLFLGTGVYWWTTARQPDDDCAARGG